MVSGPNPTSDITPLTIIELTEAVMELSNSIDRSTTDLPTGLTEEDAGYNVFSTTLGKPVWWTGTAWVDALGNPTDTEYQTIDDQIE